MASLAIIPARGGSKRIPRKNIKLFAGKPIISYSIEAARDSGRFEEIMVSTDDAEIAEVARSFGAATPFMRSESASDDHAMLKDVVLEVLEEYSKIGKSFESFCCILPTAPFIKAQDLIETGKLLESSGADEVMPVVRFSYPIKRALSMKDSRLSMIWPENMHVRSQDLEPAFHDVGMFYWMRTEAFLAQKKMMADNMVGYELPESRVQDIDSPEDWKIAEMKYQILTSNP